MAQQRNLSTEVLPALLVKWDMAVLEDMQGYMSTSSGILWKGAGPSSLLPAQQRTEAAASAEAKPKTKPQTPRLFLWVGEAMSPPECHSHH